MSEGTAFKEVCTWILLAGLPIAFIVSSSVSGWKEYHRHIEVNAFIHLLTEQTRRTHEENTGVMKDALRVLARQKSLIAIQDSDGNFTIKALDTAEKEEVKEALQRQRGEVEE